MNNTFFSDDRFSDQSVRTSRNFEKPQEHSKPSQKLATPPKTNASSTKIQTRNRTQISPIKTRVSSKKPHLTEQKLKRTVEDGCTSTQPNRNRRNLQELTLWMGTGFTRPHGGCLMILPVDQNAGALPRQTWIDSCAVLASVLHHDPPQEPAKDGTAPLRPITLRRPSQRQNHQFLKRKTQEL